MFVNNQPATVGVLRQLAPELALVHAQSETGGDFDEAQQRGLLDRYAGLSSETVANAYRHWRGIQARLRSLEQEEQDRLRAMDLWSFQGREIAGVGPQEEEDTRLEAERRVLSNSEKLLAASMSAHELLYEGSASAETALAAALKQVEELARYDARFAEQVSQLMDARAAVGDVAATVRDYAETVQSSPDRLEEIEDRLAALDRLKRKYGATLGEVIAYGEEVAGKIAEIENRDEIVKALRVELAGAEKEYAAAAEALSSDRKAAAAKLSKLAEAQINDLAMRGALRDQRGHPDRAGGLAGAWLGSGAVPHRNQCRRAAQAPRRSRLRWRDVPRAARAQGECGRGRGRRRAQKDAHAADACF